MLPQDCEVYDGLTDIILSVSLSAPKPGMFLDNIKYLIILGEIVSLISVHWKTSLLFLLEPWVLLTISHRLSLPL